MYIPTKLVIKNLLSHPNTVYNFLQGEAVMIVGENRDDDGQESNGSGKSGIIEGISVAITGKPFRKVKDCDLIKYGEEEAFIEITFENKVLKENLKIQRVISSSKNKSSTLECFINGTPQTKSFPTVLEGNKWILTKLGISREDLINYFIVSKSKSISFFSQSDNDKKMIVSRFSGTDSLLPIKEKIKVDIEELLVKKSAIESTLLRLSGKLEAFKEQLDSLSIEEQEKRSEREISSREELILNTKNEVLNLSSNKEEILDRLKVLDKKIFSSRRLVEDFKSIDYSNQSLEIDSEYSKLLEKINKKKTEVGEKNNELLECSKFISEIEKNILDSIECPKCLHTFILRDTSYNVQEAKTLLPSVKVLLSEVQEEISSLENKLLELSSDKKILENRADEIRTLKRQQEDELESYRSECSKLQNQKLNVENELQILTNILSKKNITINNLEEEIKEIKNTKLTSTDIVLEGKVRDLEEEISIQVKLLEEERERIVKMKGFEVTFTKFITHLSNKAVKSIELRTNQYLKAMGSNLSIEIEGYKVNSDGSIKEKFTTIVLRNGIQESFIESFSEGEQVRINIATTLALNNLLSLTCSKGTGLDFIVMDELMGSLDRLGVSSVMESLSLLKQTILAISHVEPRRLFNNTIRVVKEGGESRLEF